jgi:betaine reductase
VDSHGADNIVVILGSPTPESAEVYARTVTEGDPSWVGPLAGVALGLPVFHVMEPEMKSQFDPEVYKEQIGIMESVLDVDDLIAAVRQVRETVGV